MATRKKGAKNVFIDWCSWSVRFKGRRISSRRLMVMMMGGFDILCVLSCSIHFSSRADLTRVCESQWPRRAPVPTMAKCSASVGGQHRCPWLFYILSWCQGSIKVSGTWSTPLTVQSISESPFGQLKIFKESIMTHWHPQGHRLLLTYERSNSDKSRLALVGCCVMLCMLVMLLGFIYCVENHARILVLRP